MNGEGSKTPQEALLKAIVQMKNLRDSFPCKVGAIRTCLNVIRNDWEENPRLDLQQFPFSQLYTQVQVLDDIVRNAYEDDDQKVERSSPEYEEVLNLYHRFHLSSEFFTSIKVFDGIEKHLERINTVLPVRNWAIRELLSDFNANHLPLSIRRSLDSALHKFDRQEYKEVLRECREAGESLLSLYVKNLKRHGCPEAASDMGPTLSLVRKWLTGNQENDGQGHSLAPRARMEWFLLSLFETLLYLGNAGSHTRDGESQLPKWQRERRTTLVEKPEGARLILCVSFQIALELLALLDHQGNIT
jgi:hypothetical protein